LLNNTNDEKSNPRAHISDTPVKYNRKHNELTINRRHERH